MSQRPAVAQVNYLINDCYNVNLQVIIFLLFLTIFIFRLHQIKLFIYLSKILNLNFKILVIECRVKQTKFIYF